jgi:pheromone shutdown protein TraB
VVSYLDKPIPRGKLVAIVAALIVQMVVLSFALIPVDNFVYQWLFRWVPFEGAGSVTGYLTGCSRTAVIVSLA